MQIQGASYMGVALVPFSPTRDTPGADHGKGARAVYLERAGESGAVIMPDASVYPWVEDVITCWCSFPMVVHDDDMDAASQIHMRWSLRDDSPAVLTADEWARALGVR